MFENIPLAPASMSPAQRSFIEAAERRGATAPGQAVALTDMPRLTSRELAELVEQGVVREAADWRYYLFRRQGTARITESRVGRFRSLLSGRRGLLRLLLFWLVLIFIPILALQLTAGR